MTVDEMLKAIEEGENKLAENDRKLAEAYQKVEELQHKLEQAYSNKDPEEAIKLKKQLNDQKDVVDIYRNVAVTKAEPLISEEVFKTEYSRQVTEPYYKREAELRKQLLAKREAYIKTLKDAHGELTELSRNASVFMDINSRGNINELLNYIHVDMRDFFINENRYFFSD